MRLNLSLALSALPGLQAARPRPPGPGEKTRARGTPRAGDAQIAKPMPGQPSEQVLGQTPERTPEQATVRVLAQTQGQVPGQTLGRTSGQATAQMLAQTPEQVPGQPLVQTPEPTPGQIPEQTPEQAAAQVLAQAPEQIPPPWHFRPARADDAAVCAPLVFASGVREFGFFLGESDERCIAFLRFAFASGLGRFSWRRHRVACAGDASVLAVLAAHDHRDILLDDLHVAWMLLRFFGPLKTIGMLLRGLVLERELPAPRRGQTLIAHCATDARVRGTGIFTALFADAHASGWLRCAAGGEYVLDVLLDNVRARSLYERLGFVAIARSRARSRRLPADLASQRMRWQGFPARQARIAEHAALLPD